MYAGDERWWQRRELMAEVATQGLSFEHMIYAFPDGAGQEFATLVYAQSAAMVHFLLETGGLVLITDLFDALRFDDVTPEEAWGVALGVLDVDFPEAWLGFLEEQAP